MIIRLERFHPFREFGKDVLFLDRVVDRQHLAELETLGEEGPQGHAGRAGAGFARLVEDVPGVAEMVVVAIHHDGEAIVGGEVLG